MGNLLNQDKVYIFSLGTLKYKTKNNQQIFVGIIRFILSQGKHFLLKLGNHNLICLHNFKIQNWNFQECKFLGKFRQHVLSLSISLFFKDNTSTADLWAQNEIVFRSPKKSIFCFWFCVFQFFCSLDTLDRLY